MGQAYSRCIQYATEENGTVFDHYGPAILEKIWDVNEGMVQLQNLNALRKLEIISSPLLVSLSEGMYNLTSLKYLTIESCDDLMSLNLTSLKYLTIESCDDLMSLNKCLQLLTNLHVLAISDCREMELLSIDFQNLVSLQSLHLEGLPKLAAVPVIESTLESVSFIMCPGLKNLPEWITDQRLLQTLDLDDCKNLKSLPEGLQHLTALQCLQIIGCYPELHRRCQKNTGKDWYKIGHSPDIINRLPRVLSKLRINQI